jgi:hypothetical protein
MYELQRRHLPRKRIFNELRKLCDWLLFNFVRNRMCILFSGYILGCCRKHELR